MLVTRWDVLTAAHPALLILVAAILVLGLLHAALAVRRLRTPGPERRAGIATPSRGRRIAAVLARTVVVIASLALLAGTAWLRPFPADSDALAEAHEAAAGSDGTITSTPTTLTLTPADPGTRTGMIFQPGARVDPRAYVPMLSRIAEAGYTVVIVKQPLQIGFLATGAHRAIIEQHPDIDHWALAGHSLGGVVAPLAVEDTDVDALVLWAAYPAGPLDAPEGLVVTSVSGSADGLTTPADIEATRDDLPAETRYVVIDGAVHAYFGDYGPQSGDGTPTISRSAAQESMVTATIETLDRLAGTEDG